MRDFAELSISVFLWAHDWRREYPSSLPRTAAYREPSSINPTAHPSGGSALLHCLFVLRSDYLFSPDL